MDLVMLMVLFSTPAEPAPHTAHGFGPRPMRSVEHCLERRSYAQKYIEGIVSDGTVFSVFCVTFEAHGYEDARDALARRVGDDM